MYSNIDSTICWWSDCLRRSLFIAALALWVSTGTKLRGDEKKASSFSQYPLNVQHIDVQLKANGAGQVVIKYSISTELANTLNSKESLLSLGDYGVNLKHSVREQSKGDQVSVEELGVFDDVFSVIRLIDSSVPFCISPDKYFSVIWNGDLLEIKMWRAGNMCVDKQVQGPSFRFSADSFTIDRVSTGQISQSGESISVTPDDLSRDQFLLRFIKM